MIKYQQSMKYVFEHSKYYPQIAWLTSEISLTYAGHQQWIDQKFLPGLEKANSRGYVFAIDEACKDWSMYRREIPTYSGSLVGCSLLKNEPDEKKICCLFISPKYRKQGIASNLIEKSFELLQTDKPLMTVAENNLSQLQRLIDKYNFELTSVKESVYKPGVKEYFYNEGLAR